MNNKRPQRIEEDERNRVLRKTYDIVEIPVEGELFVDIYRGKELTCFTTSIE
ncbi:MAG: hypothetical protein ACFFDI_06485 [Promethearchaeota archaeon]